MRALLLVAVALVACTRPSEDRALADLDVGHATLASTRVDVEGGMAAIRKLEDRRLEIWVSAPDVTLTIFVDSTSTGEWTIVANNVVDDARLFTRTADILREPGTRPTVATFRVALTLGENKLEIRPPDVFTGPYRVAALADIQQAMPDVHEVFEQISAVPDLRFVVGMGDITNRAEIAEYELYEQKLLSLDIPFYTTIGNHELWADADRWFTRYGRMNFQFQYKGAFFTFADSGDAGIDPIVEGWLDEWLATGKNDLNIFLTHIPPIDPVGHRYGGFRSMRDGHRLLARLADNDVDLTLYGHIHTYVGFENAGIPAHISGGGGADPMRFDGIDRHFLILDIDPDNRTIAVDVHRVD